MTEITAENGGDPTNAIVEVLDENAAELAQSAIDFWFAESQDWLAEAAQNRSTIASEGRTGRETNGLSKIQQTAVPPSWDESEEAWVFSYPHHGAVFQEFGAQPTEIRAKEAEVLAFEWPDAPQEVQEQFEHTEGDLVFFESIDHPGIPAIGFVRRGRDKTRERLRRRGIESEEYGARGDGSE